MDARRHGLLGPVHGAAMRTNDVKNISVGDTGEARTVNQFSFGSMDAHLWRDTNIATIHTT